jgi:formate hydrogenlyase transcriptional activator
MSSGDQSYRELLAVLRSCGEATAGALGERELFQSLCDIFVSSGLFQLAWFGYADENTQKIVGPLAHSEDHNGFFEDLESALRQPDYEDSSNMAIQSGKVCWIKDYRELPALTPIQIAALERGLNSVVSVPVILQSRQRGAFTLHYSDSKRFEQPTINVLAEWFALLKSALDKRLSSREHEAELRAVLDAIPHHVTLYSAEARGYYYNRVALDYHGHTATEMQSGADVQVVHPEDLECAVKEFHAGLIKGAPFKIEHRLRRSDGEFHWFQGHVTPLRDELGNITRWCCIATDIHDQKLAKERLQNENIALREEVDRASMFEEIVGVSEPLKKVVSRISRVAPTDSGVLITGETGTGKELVARAIHRLSSRSRYPFVSVNCAAIPRDLIASELFGHEKGAFTGAAQRRIGRFELAAGGTLFLDEVGDLPTETQVALLRVLQEREFERVGGSRSIQTDVRVLAATNRDLETDIAAGKFRGDLFYRLNVFPIEVPPLRERCEDIPLLVEYFLDRYARKAGKNFQAVDKKSLVLLQSYPWPGNIRELQNVIERSVIVSDSETFSVDESWLSRQFRAELRHSHPELSRRPAATEKTIIEAALRECGGRVSGVSGAAARLGIPGSTLESKIKSLKIDKNRFRTTS